MTTRQTSSNKYGVAKWIVDATAAVGTHTTIAAAITAASSGDSIAIRPGTYTENLTLKAGVNLFAFECDAFTPNVTIKGKMTATYSGTVSCSGIRFETNGDYFIESTGSNTLDLNLDSCYLNCNDFSGIHCTNTNADINCFFCKGDKKTTGIKLVSMSAGTVNLDHTFIENTGGSVTPEAISGGTLGANFSVLSNGVLCSSTGSINFSYVKFTCPSGLIALQSTSSSISVLYFCNLPVGGGVASVDVTGSGAIRFWGCNNLESSATYAITGTGTVVYDFITTGNVNADLDPSLSLTTRRVHTGSLELNGSVIVRSGSGSPNGSVTSPKGSLFLRTDGSSSSTRAYINTNGTTGWTAITTAS